MNKFIKALALSAVVVLVSSQVFAAITIKELSCSAPRTSQGAIVGVGYTVHIRGGFDTHVVNPDGTIGAPMEPSFQLIARVVAPHAMPHITDLVLRGRNSDGAYLLSADGVEVVVDYGLRTASLAFTVNGATAVCQ
jgi:hypothetical protein